MIEVPRDSVIMADDCFDGELWIAVGVGSVAQTYHVSHHNIMVRHQYERWVMPSVVVEFLNGRPGASLIVREGDPQTFVVIERLACQTLWDVGTTSGQ